MTLWHTTSPMHKTLWHTRVTVPLESYRGRKPCVQVPSMPLLQFLLCVLLNSSPIVSCALHGREFGTARGHPLGRAYHSMTPSHRIHNVLSVYISALSLNCMRKLVFNSRRNVTGQYYLRRRRNLPRGFILVEIVEESILRIFQKSSSPKSCFLEEFNVNLHFRQLPFWKILRILSSTISTL